MIIEEDNIDESYWGGMEDDWFQITIRYEKEDVAQKVKNRILKNETMRNNIKQELKKLPIYCKVCNKKLTFSGSYTGYFAFGCSGMIEGDEYGWIKGRKPADDHYNKSRICMSNDQWNSYEYFEKVLNQLLK